MEISKYLSHQMQEALGADNKWFCSQYYGYEICDQETLLSYYIKHGGAKHFREKAESVTHGEKAHN